MAIYKVIQVWSRDHTESERDSITNFCIDLYNANLFIPAKTKVVLDKNNENETVIDSFSEYVPNMTQTQYVITKFATEASAQQYINFVSNLDPISLTIEVEN